MAGFKGFTLLEIMISVVIIGILASIAFPRYIKVVERGRTAEARNALGLIRSAEASYGFEYNGYTADINVLQLGLPTSCSPSYYYSYGITGGGGTFTASAVRCTSGGKEPNSPGGVAYILNITQSGVIDGTPGYL